MRYIKNALLLVAIIALASTRAFSGSISYTFTDTLATGSSIAQSLKGTGVLTHTLTWTGSGTRTSCTIKLEQSVTGTSGWSDLIANQDCTTNGTATATAQVNYVRTTISLSGLGNTLYSRYDGAPAAPSVGSVTVTGGATGTNQTSGAQITQLGDGTHAATPFFHLGTLYAPGFALVDASGNQITSFGGGTQYASGAAQATPTGTAMLWGDGTNVWAPSATHPLPISLPSATITTLTPPAAITGFATSAKQDTSNAALGSTTDTGSKAIDTTSATMIALLKGLISIVNDGTNISGAVTSAMTGTTSTQVIAGTASNYQYITHCSFNNDHASVTTYMNLQDGTGGTVLWSVNVPFAGGREVDFGARGLKVPTAGNGLFVVNVTTGSSTTVACLGYKSTVSY